MHSLKYRQTVVYLIFLTLATEAGGTGIFRSLFGFSASRISSCGVFARFPRFLKRLVMTLFSHFMFRMLSFMNSHEYYLATLSCAQSDMRQMARDALQADGRRSPRAIHRGRESGAGGQAWLMGRSGAGAAVGVAT